MIAKPSDCCNPCGDPPTTSLVGPQGAAGTNGTNGTNGLNAYTALTAAFTVPAELATAVATVGASAWATIGQIIFLQFAGWFQVTAKPSSTQLTLKNLKDTASAAYMSNVAPATVIPIAAAISPGGMQGPQGLAGSASLDAISPTGFKGDLMVDDGVNSPLASVQRLTVGVNGERLVADSAQPLGVKWAKTDLSNPAEVVNETPVANGGTGQATTTLGFDALSPTTTQGDLITNDGTNNVRLGLGASGEVLQSDGTNPVYGKIEAPNLGPSFGVVPVDLIIVQERQATGVDAGAFNNAARRTRQMNNEVVDTGNFCTVAANQITLNGGTYRFRAEAIAYKVDNHQAFLQNVSDGVTVGYGTTANSDAAGTSQTHSVVIGRFTIPAAKTFELQHQCVTTKAVNGMGLASNFGGPEVYSQIVFEREAL